MKIDSTHIASAAKAQAAASAANSQKSRGSNPSNSADDSSEVSSIGMLAAKVGGASEARIQELKKQVQAGNYSVPASEVSKKIVDSLLPE